RELAERIAELAATPVPAGRAAGARPTTADERRAEVEHESGEQPQNGMPSGLTCPECHGALWETTENGMTRFRGRTGHEFSPESLVAEQSEHVERALWAALRALEEKAAMLHGMAARSLERGHYGTAHRLERRAAGSVQGAFAIRTLLDGLEHDESVLEEQ